MVDIVITPANVVSGADARTISGTAGATITAGQAVYLDTATNTYKLADADGASALIRTPVGIALHGASANQPVTIQRSGDMTIGGTLTAGVAYYLSGTPGGICPVADVGVGEYSCILGIAKSTTVLDVNIQASGVSL